MMRPGIEPRSPGPLANTRPISQLSGYDCQLVNGKCCIVHHTLAVIMVHFNVDSDQSESDSEQTELLLHCTVVVGLT